VAVGLRRPPALWRGLGLADGQRQSRRPGRRPSPTATGRARRSPCSRSTRPCRISYTD